jgi:hypothetical protein
LSDSDGAEIREDKRILSEEGDSQSRFWLSGGEHSRVRSTDETCGAATVAGASREAQRRGWAIFIAAAFRLWLSRTGFCGCQGWLVFLGAKPAVSTSDPGRRAVRLRCVVRVRFSQRYLLVGNPSQGRQMRQLRDGPRTVYLAFDADTNGSGQQAAQFSRAVFGNEASWLVRSHCPKATIQLRICLPG